MKFEFVEDFDYTEDEITRLSGSVIADGNNLELYLSDVDGNCEHILTINGEGVIHLACVGEGNSLNLPVAKNGKLKVAR